MANKKNFTLTDDNENELDAAALFTKDNQEAISKFLTKKKFKEVKSRKVQLLMKPSIYKKVKEMADYTGESVNFIINDAIEEYVKNHFDEIEIDDDTGDD